MPNICIYFTILATWAILGSSTESFGLYAYGDEIGGLPLYYADGNAVISHQPPTNATIAAAVIFTQGATELVGNPNDTTSSKKPQFSDVSLFVPDSSSASHQIGFTGNATSRQVMNKFVWYGNFLLVENDSGDYTSLFAVKKPTASGSDGSYSLLWNVTDGDEELVPITMRSVAPSNGS